MEENVSSRYEKLCSIRRPVCDRAETYSLWTIPSIFPDTHEDDDDAIVNAFNSIGAEAVNNLTNKLTVALFNPSRPFFRIKVEEEVKRQIADNLQLDSDLQISSILSSTENEAMDVLSRRGLRSAAFDAFQLLIVTGNALLYYPAERKDEDIQVFNLRDYVVERDVYGKVRRIIICEEKVFGSLSDENKEKASMGRVYGEDDTVRLFTDVNRKRDGKFEVRQFLEDVELTNSDTKGVYPESKLPYVTLTWRRARNRNYGTSLVEEYAGDFHALTVLVESYVKGLADLADIKKMVDPSGLTDVDELVESEFGAYVSGRATDITVPQSNKGADYNVLMNGIDSFSKRIARAFLLGSAVVRDSERTTATEVMQQAQELETSLGGVYTRLAEEMQKPLCSQALLEVNDAFTRQNGIEPSIITGMEAISRYRDMDNFKMWMNDMAMLQQIPESVRRRLKVDRIGEYSAASRGLDASDFIYSEEEAMAMMQQEQAMQQQPQQQQPRQQG